MKFIRQVLEDREREDKFRLKRLKAKKDDNFLAFAVVIWAKQG